MLIVCKIVFAELTINPSCAALEKRLLRCKVWKDMRLEHGFDTRSQICMQSDSFLKASKSEEKSFLDSPIGVSSWCHCIGILLHIVGSEVEERHQVVRLEPFALLRLMGADALDQFNRSDLWHIHAFVEVSLLTYVLYRVFMEQLLVPVWDKHEWNSSLVEDILDKGLHLVHSKRYFRCRWDQLHDKV